MLVAVVLFQTVTRKNNVFYNPAPDVDGFHRLIYSLLNFLIVGQDYVSSFSFYHFHREDNHIIPPAWSVASELLFYVLAPFIVILRSRVARVAAIVLFFSSVGLRVFIVNHQAEVTAWCQGVFRHRQRNSLPGRYRLFHATLAYFLLGYLSYRFYVRVRGILPMQMIGRRIGKVVLVVGVVVLLVSGKLAYFSGDLDSPKLWLTYIAVALPEFLTRGATPPPIWYRQDRDLGECCHARLFAFVR